MITTLFLSGLSLMTASNLGVWLSPELWRRQFVVHSAGAVLIALALWFK